MEPSGDTSMWKLNLDLLRRPPGSGGGFGSVVIRVPEPSACASQMFLG